MLAYSIMAVPICHHLTHKRRSAGNTLLGTLVGATVFVNYQVYRRYHLEHHRLVGTPDDPEGDHKIETIKQYLSQIFIEPVCSTAITHARICTSRYPSYLREHDRSIVAINHAALVFWVGIVVTACMLVTTATILLYCIPVYLGAFVIEAFFSLPEHVKLSYTDSDHGKNIKSNWLVRRLTLRQNFHAQHHLTPNLLVKPWSRRSAK